MKTSKTDTNTILASDAVYRFISAFFSLIGALHVGIILDVIENGFNDLCAMHWAAISRNTFLTS